MSFPHYAQQICFVSGQNLPSLLGVSFPQAEPSVVHLVCTLQMKEKSKEFAEALRERGRKVVLYDLATSRREGVFDVLDAVYTRGETHGSFGMNITGGTKLMAFAAFEWARVYDIPVFYIDTEQNEVLFLHDAQWKSIPLPSLLTVKTLLSAYGYRVEGYHNTPLSGETRDVLRRMAALIIPRPQLIKRLNWCAMQALNSRFVRDDGEQSREWKDVLALCAGAGKLSLGNRYIHFTDEASRVWCNGIWLEEYVQAILYKLEKDKAIDSWGASVSVRKQGIPNELDALFTVRNRLFVIECKTAAMPAEKKSGGQKVVDILYKADSLPERLGGIFSQAMLCSVAHLDEPHKKRAESLKIRLVCGNDLLKLEEKIKHWIQC